MQRCGLREKLITGAVEEEDREMRTRARAHARVRERERERERGAQGNTQENVSPKLFAWNTRVAEFLELLQPMGLKAWSFKSQWAWLG